MRRENVLRTAASGRLAALSRVLPVLLALIFSGATSLGPDSSPPSPSVFAPKIGVCASLGNAAAAQSAGCDYLEEGVRSFLVPDRPEAEFLAKSKGFEKSPLPILACNGFLPESLKSVGPDCRPEEILAFAETAFRRARRIGVRHIVFGSSGSRNIPDGFDREEARRQFVRLLRQMGPVAGTYGVTVVIEPLNRSECNFINTVAEGAGIVTEAGHPNIRLLADIYHMLRENEGPESLLAAGPLLRHCHIAEKEGRTPPGVAGDDFGPYFEALREIGYEGGISIECRWDDLTREISGAVRALKEQILRIDEKNLEN